MAIQFEPKISLGNLLTIVSFAGAAFGAYESLDRRVTVVEVGQQRQAEVDKSQDEQSRLNNQYILSSLNDIKHTVEKMNDKLDQWQKR